MDTNGPVITDVTISAFDSSSVTITWTTDENSSSLVDIGTDLTYGRTEGNLEDNVKSHSVTIRNLNPGETYYFRVRSTDPNGHETIDDNGESGYSFTTHALASITNVEVSNITDTAATVTWNSDVNAYSYINYGTTESYGVIIGKEDAVTQNHTITVAGLNPSTTYYFRARVKDISGNYSLGSSGSFTTLSEGSGNGNQNNQSPSISSIKTSNGDNGSVVVTWKTNKDCNGMVRFGLDKKYGQSAGEDTTIYALDQFSTKHEVILNDVLSNTTYHFAVVSYDASGNIAVSGDKTFKTPALSGISNVKVTNTSLSSAIIVWETSDPSTSAIDYGLTTAYGKQAENTKLENMHKIELTGLEAGKTYHFRVNAKNKNDTSVSSDDYIFATNPMPTLGNYTVGEVTDSKITLEWTTNVETDSMVGFVNRDNPEEKGEQGDPTLTTNHKLIINGLSEGTNYDIKISGTDANTNSFESIPFLVTTFKDVTAPEIGQVNTESSLIGGKDDKVQSIIYWRTNEGATSQVVFDTKKSGDISSYTQSSKEDDNLTTNHVVVLTNLNSGTVYYFMVVSKDKNGNESHSEAFSLLTPRKEKSIIQMIIANFEETFGWMKKMKSN
jgi:chitodextrinase